MFLGSLGQLQGNFKLSGLAAVGAPVQHIVIGPGDSGIYQTVRLIRQKVAEAIHQPTVQKTVKSILAGIEPGSSQREIAQAFVRWFGANIRYRTDDDMSMTEDGLKWLHLSECRGKFQRCEAVEMVYDAPQILQQRYGDCLPGETLLLTPQGFKEIAVVNPGDVVMGEGKFTRVLNHWEKGVLPTLNIKLSSGDTLTVTHNHRMLLEFGEERKACELDIDDRLLSPQFLNFENKTEHLDPDLAWLIGVYIADGWRDDSRVCISGKDGHPKEAQKKKVQAICERFGYSTRWHERYIAINSKEVVELVRGCGSRAYDKQVPSLNFDLGSIKHILSGIASDASLSKSGTLTYNTISRTLAFQIRVLHRILGEKTTLRRVENHGGLGTHPIYRINLIKSEHPSGRKVGYLSVKVREIQDGPDIQVFDIQTETGKFYLPEHDIIVHNCDDQVLLMGAFLQLVGIRWCPVVVALDSSTPRDFSHIYLVANLDGSMVPIDTVNTAQPFGWQPESPFRREVLC